ncbi:MAG: hypothetical protein MMC33_010421, partial [Icmadophila ericetorum]|nr:hypothetical protein [Icmadophila ericetorum]
KAEDTYGMTSNNPPTSGSWRGVLGSSEFPAENDRYHLYVGLFCPFAHRVLLTRELKGLQSFLPLTIVRPYPKPWQIPKANDHSTHYPGSTVDPIFGAGALSEVYFRSPPHYTEYTGKYSVPVLWDKKTNQIVNNESEDIMRMLNTAFNEFLPEGPQRHLNFYPEIYREEIDDINSWLVPDLNGGVYRAGFAQTQEDYEKACKSVFATLDKLQSILASHDGFFILGGHFTELDLKATLIRFDTVYVTHFKCNIGTIRHDYPILNRYMKNIYWKVGGSKETTNFKHIKDNYFKSHGDINPKGFTPVGPIPDVEKWTEEDEKWRKGWVGEGK